MCPSFDRSVCVGPFGQIQTAYTTWKLLYFDGKQRTRAQWKIECPATSTLVLRVQCDTFCTYHAEWQCASCDASTIPVFLSRHRSLETHSLLMSNLCHTALNDFVTLQDASTYKRTAKEKRFNVCLSVTMLRNHWELQLSGWKRGKSATVSFHYTSVTANTTTSYKSRVVYRRISSLTSNMQESPIVNFSSSIYFFVCM